MFRHSRSRSTPTTSTLSTSRAASGHVLNLLVAATVVFACRPQPFEPLEARGHPPPVAVVHPLEGCELIRSELTPRMLELPYDADAWRATLRFYDTSAREASWWTGRDLGTAGVQVLDVLRAADRLDGLDASTYGTDSLTESVARASALRLRERCTLDFALTYRVALYATHLARGIVSPSDVTLPVQTALSADDPDIAAVIAQAVAGRSVAGAVATVRPSHPWYTPLVRAQASYRALADVGGWPAVPDGPTLEPADRASAGRIVALARRLDAEGYLDATPSGRSGSGPPPPRIAAPPTESADADEDEDGTLRYNPALVRAVVSFQAHHGLEPDGIVGSKTLAALNVPVTERVRSIETTLEHLRWLPAVRPVPPLMVIVNVPGFELHVVERGRVALRLRTIVGRRSWRTPLLGSAIDHLVLNPEWNIPDSITRGEIIAKLSTEPDYLERQQIHVLDDTGTAVDPTELDWAAVADGRTRVRLRQVPGPLNPLGRVKFQFTSPFGVYVHDTNAVSLFDQPERSLSHGCIRLDRPFELAVLLTRRAAPSWPASRLHEAVTAGARDRVPLVPPVPIHVVYWTATIGPDGRVDFSRDLYGVDEATRVALAEVSERQASAERQ